MFHWLDMKGRKRSTLRATHTKEENVDGTLKYFVMATGEKGKTLSKPYLKKHSAYDKARRIYRDAQRSLTQCDIGVISLLVYGEGIPSPDAVNQFGTLLKSWHSLGNVEQQELSA